MQQHEDGIRQPDPVNRYIGTCIRVRRKMLGMSQQQLAAVLGVTFQQIQKYEKGTSGISAGHLHRISSAMQVAPSFFFPPTQERPEGRQESICRAVLRFLSSADAVELNLAAVKIRDPMVRRRVVDLVRSIAKTSH